MKYFLERIPKPKMKKPEENLTNGKITEVIKQRNARENNNEQHSYSSIILRNKALEKAKVPEDLIEKFERINQETSVLYDEQNKQSSKKMLMKRLLSKGIYNARLEYRKVNNNPSLNNSTSVNCSSTTDKPTQSKDEIVQPGISPNKREFLKKVKENLFKKFNQDESRLFDMSEILENSVKKKVEDSSGLELLVNSTFGSNKNIIYEKEPTKSSVLLPKIRHRKVLK